MAYPKTYKTDKGVYEIPEKEVSSFLKDFPNAMEVVSYKMGKDTFDIPVQETEVFLKENPQAVPLKKKEPSGNGLQEPSDGGLGGTTPKTETFPTIEMYQTPTGDLTEDPFAQVKKSKELLGKTKVVSKGGIGGMGMGTTGTEIVPDEEATKEANKIQEELKRTGYKEDFFAGISDLPEDVYNNPTTSKETLSVLYKNNPVKFTQLTNEAKNKYAIRDAAAKKAYDEAQGDDKQKTEYASRVGILKGNEYSGDEIAPPENMQQFYDIVRQKQQLIDQNIDSPEEKKKAQERLRQTYAQAINPTSLDFREEYQNSGLADKLDVTQYAGLKTYELFEPEKAKVLRSMVEANITPQWNVNVQVTPEEQVRSIVTDSAMAEKMCGTLSQLTVNKRIGKEEALRELSLLGATNEYDSIVSEQNDLKNKYKEAQTDEEKANIYAKMLLNEQRANDLQKTEAKNDERYPITAKLKMDNLVKEIVQDRGIGVGGWMYNKYAHGVGSGVDAVENLVTSIFGSEKEKTDLRMKRIGEGKQFEASIYLPESERSVNSPVIIQASDELKKKAKEILNGRSLSELSPDEKNKLSQLVASNQDQIKTITNPEAGKSKNFWSKATGMTIAGFTADMGSFLTKMGLMQGVGMGAKAAEATTLFMDGYEPAFNKKLAEGASVESANEYGILHGAVLSLMSKFGSKYETIKNVVKGGNSPISKYIAGLSEESWNKLAGEAKPLLSRLGKASKDIVKEQGKMIGTFGVAAPVTSAVADNLFYDEGRSVREIADEALLSAKEMAIGGIGFGLFGLAKGVMKTKATPVEKAALFEMADYSGLGKMRIDEAVKSREISKEEGERKKGIIDNVSRLVEQVPEVNDKGKPLNDQQRANYLFNLAVKESQKEKAKTLPEKQAEEAKQKALVADKENQIELEALTEKQLNDRKDKLEKAISKLDEKGKPELSDKEMADAKAELQAVENIIKSKGDTSKTEEKLPKLSEPIEGTDEYGVSIGEDVPAETKPLTKEAEDLLASIGEGSKPTFITKNLERIAKENGIEVTDKMSADDVINALKEKQKQPSEQVGSVVGKTETQTQPIELSAEGKNTEIYAEKPDLKLELVSANDLVNSKDPIGNRERHNEIKERYKKLRQLIDCL